MKTPDAHETLLALSAQIKNGIEKGIATPNEKIIESIKSICKLQSSGNYSRICFGGEQTMKTPEEIKKGLECCPGQYSSIGCGKCPYSIDGRYCGRNGDQPMKDALVYIQQLEASCSQVSKALCGKENATLEEVLQAVRQVKAELEAVRRERDAARLDMKRSCNICKHAAKSFQDEPCNVCAIDTRYLLFEWRGVCPENAEVQDDE